MSSDSSDSESERQHARRRSTAERNSANSPASPPPDGESKGPRTPGSPVSNKSFESLSPEGPRTPSSPRQSRSRSRSPKQRARSGSPSSRSRSVGSLGSRSPSTSPAPKRGPRSPPEKFDDDGRSNISSGSSILSRGSPKVNGVKSSPAKVPFSVPNAEDLSDVSDIGEVEEDGLGSPKDSRDSRRDREQRRVDDDGEQLDFEDDDQPDVDKEDGECEREREPPSAPKEKKEDEVAEKDGAGGENGEEKSGDEGECKDEDAESLEEGEVSDDGDPKPEKPPICRFYSRGACTWGNSCRFLHPGVTDKGNYSMFDTARPIVGSNGLYPEPRPYPLMMPPARVLAGPYGPVVRREDPAGVESAWERGLRHAKEMVRISSKRKESDMDFEDKKMNMSIGQEEMDKENDYYTRVGSPAEPEAWPTSRLSPRREEGELRRPVRVVERYEDILPEPIPAAYDRFDHRRIRDPEYMLRRDKYMMDEDGRKSKKMVREVIAHRAERGKRALSPDGRKPDEWRDPWMRTRSPPGKSRSRKVSYSSGSSSYSGSSSRSSSKSSYSSYSRSRSRSGSRSPAGRRRGRSPPPTGIPVRPKGPEGKFKPLKLVSTPAPAAVEKAAERPLLMNPPAPSPLRNKRILSPTAAIRKVGLNPPAPTPKKSQSKRGNKARGKKRSSSSGSSGSSSDSSHSSYSSSSSHSSTKKSPPARAGKKGDAEAKNKEIRGGAKATLKTDKQPAATIAGKKRPAEDAPPAKEASPGKTAGSKKGSSRREELLKQLKAVEDAIARKRSKI